MDQQAGPSPAPAPGFDTTMSRNTPAAVQGPPVRWEVFLDGLAEEIDSLAGVDERDDMLRGVGHRMSRMLPVPAVQTLAMLEIEINDVLANIGWGRASLYVNETEHALEIVHTGLPRIGPAPGEWLAALLGGLYDGWFAQQPGAQPTLHTRRVPTHNPTDIVMRYSRP